ncbi:hypothetical protein CISIN_1g0293301mg, partial [Citrus sinensis]
MTTSFIVEQAPKSSILALSSDSESCKDSSLLREEKEFQFQGKEMDEDAALTGRDEKTSVKKVSTLTLPLVISEKLQLTKAFVECEGESIDLSGDMGAVGRILVPGTAEGNHVMFLDLKGTIYKTTLVPSRTFCI